MKVLVFALAVAVSTAAAGHSARAECRCVAVAADVTASVQAEVARADGLYARGDFAGAHALYAKAYATTKDAALLYAQAMCQWQLGVSDQAKAMFEAYLAAGGTLAYRDRAEAGLRDVGAGVAATVAGGAIGVGSTALGGVGATAGVAGDLHAKVDRNRPKIGRKAGIVLGVIAIAAIGAVGIHSISAGVSDDIELDPKFDLGLGVAGVAVGISAIYVAGLTATAGAAGGLRCASQPRGKPLVAPLAVRGGGGVTAVMSF